MRIPEPAPFGETFREAKVRAIVAASFVNRLAGGWVESVVTFATHRFFGAGVRAFVERRAAMCASLC